MEAEYNRFFFCAKYIGVQMCTNLKEKQKSSKNYNINNKNVDMKEFERIKIIK